METTAEIEKLSDLIKKGTRVISLSGLTSISAKSYVLSKLQNETKKTLVVITDSNRELETWENDLDFWSQESKEKTDSEFRTPHSAIKTLPSFESDIYSAISPHAETLERRALALWNLSKSKPNFVLTSAKSLITKILSPGRNTKTRVGLKT